MAYGQAPEPNGRGRDLLFAGVVVMLAVATLYLPASTQQGISGAFRGSALRPFIAVQELLGDARVRRAQVDSLYALVDSLSSRLSTHAALEDENDTLRELLALGERAGPQYLPATVTRPGTPGSESMFLVDVGFEDGVGPGSPVVSPEGLVGVIREVRAQNAVGMDWTHPDFRVSAMLADGSSYGLVENRPGRFREDDRLVLNGVPYHQEVAVGVQVVTSGLGGVFPRGIPIGRIDGLADEEGTWRRSYWLVPVAEPGAATHVLVMQATAELDVSGVWLEDSVEEAPERGITTGQGNR